MALTIKLYDNIKRKVDLYLSVRQYQASADLIKGKLTHYPHDFNLMKLLSTVYFFQNKIQEAFDLIVKCVEKQPDEKESQLLSIAMFCDTGEYGKAQELYLKLRNNPQKLINKTLPPEKFTKNLILCGLTFYESNNFAKALIQFSQALTLKPDCLEAAIGLAKTQIKLGEFDKAHMTLSRLCKSHPENHLIQLWLGVVYYQLDKLNLAYLHISKARDLNPDDKTVGTYSSFLDMWQQEEL